MVVVEDSVLVSVDASVEAGTAVVSETAGATVVDETSIIVVVLSVGTTVVVVFEVGTIVVVVELATTVVFAGVVTADSVLQPASKRAREAIETVLIIWITIYY